MSKRQAVSEFDLNRYLGTWYEIARFDHSFEKGLTGVSATYSLRPDGKISVTNQGYKNTLDGQLRKANGKAKFAGNKQSGHLKVSFFLFFYADYLVLAIDKDYRWALVGSSSDKYLWILSRSPQMDEITYNSVVALAKGKGYNTNRLIRVEQKTEGSAQ